VLGTAVGLATQVGPALGAIFALLLIDASIIGACFVNLATSYAFGGVVALLVLVVTTRLPSN